MSNSTFWSDGYMAGLNGDQCSPPDAYLRGDGQATDVYINEYRDGYESGLQARSSASVMGLKKHFK